MKKTTLVTLAALGFSLILLLSPNRALGNDVQSVERITIDPAANFDATPKSFAITEDNIFLIPDSMGTVKVFSKEGNSLKFIKALGPKIDKTRFKEPWYCVYSRNEGKLGVINFKARKVFILKRNGHVEFTSIKSVDRPRSAYDIDFTEMVNNWWFQALWPTEKTSPLTCTV